MLCACHVKHGNLQVRRLRRKVFVVTCETTATATAYASLLHIPLNLYDVCPAISVFVSPGFLRLCALQFHSWEPPGNVTSKNISKILRVHR